MDLLFWQPFRSPHFLRVSWLESTSSLLFCCSFSCWVLEITTLPVSFPVCFICLCSDPHSTWMVLSLYTDPIVKEAICCLFSSSSSNWLPDRSRVCWSHFRISIGDSFRVLRRILHFHWLLQYDWSCQTVLMHPHQQSFSSKLTSPHSESMLF